VFYSLGGIALGKFVVRKIEISTASLIVPNEGDIGKVDDMLYNGAINLDDLE